MEKENEITQSNRFRADGFGNVSAGSEFQAEGEPALQRGSRVKAHWDGGGRDPHIPLQQKACLIETPPAPSFRALRQKPMGCQPSIKGLSLGLHHISNWRLLEEARLMFGKSITNPKILEA